MDSVSLESLKYPVGKFVRPKEFSQSEVRNAVDVIGRFPALLHAEVSSLTDEELRWTYRPEGWNIRQVVHHVADSHMNAFVRFKLSLTEETPTIKPYKENLWAELPDVLTVPIDASVQLIAGLHQRWAVLMGIMSEQDWCKGYQHPEQNRIVPLFDAAAIYGWHCGHHLAHIRLAKKNRGTK
jgi:hypothetical protein